MAALGITPHTPSQELEIVISNILSGGPAMIPANDYLLHFIETEAAWGGALGLFDCTNIQIRYFAANIVYTKVKKHWVQLNEAQQQEIFVYLLEYITQASVNAGDNKIFLDRCLMMPPYHMLELACLSTQLTRSGIALKIRVVFSHQRIIIAERNSDPNQKNSNRHACRLSARHNL